MSSFVAELNSGISLEPNENVFGCIWKEYERVILQSLVTSFGLDFLVHDQYGGDVDTIHNVREIGKDVDMHYKNLQNQENYKNRGAYDNTAYHADKRYRDTVKKAKKDFNEKGILLEDTYVAGNTVAPVRNKTLPRNRQGQLDHVVSADDVHNDPGRILAGLDGMKLANSPENLRYTNAALNRNLSNMSVEEYIKWCEENPSKVNWNGKKGEPLPEDVKKRLRTEYRRAKKEYDAKLAKAYYTSPKFAKDAAVAAGHRGVEMGARQAMGVIFMEIWFASKEELQTAPPHSDLKDMLEMIARGIKNGLNNARHKYKELVKKFEEGFVAGALSNLTTTICNIFFTTAKNLVHNIRQIYASVVEAGKVLLYNPDNLMFGDRIKTSTLILATGASVLVGTAVGELIAVTPIGQVPVIGNAVQVFCSTLVSGLLSCSLLVFLDRSKFMNKVVDQLNRIPFDVNNYKEIADALEKLAVKIADLNIEKFRNETTKYSQIAMKINSVTNEDELNELLLDTYKSFGIKIPWEGNFDEFMTKKTNRLVFE